MIQESKTEFFTELYDLISELTLSLPPYSVGYIGQPPLTYCGRELHNGVNDRRQRSLGTISETGYHCWFSFVYFGIKSKLEDIDYKYFHDIIISYM